MGRHKVDLMDLRKTDTAGRLRTGTEDPRKTDLMDRLAADTMVLRSRTDSMDLRRIGSTGLLNIDSTDLPTTGLTALRSIGLMDLHRIDSRALPPRITPSSAPHPLSPPTPRRVGGIGGPPQGKAGERGMQTLHRRFGSWTTEGRTTVG